MPTKNINSNTFWKSQKVFFHSIICGIMEWNFYCESFKKALQIEKCKISKPETQFFCNVFRSYHKLKLSASGISKNEVLKPCLSCFNGTRTVRIGGIANKPNFTGCLKYLWEKHLKYHYTWKTVVLALLQCGIIVALYWRHFQIRL